MAHATLERELGPALSRRARRASGFPIFELDALTRWLRPRIVDLATNEGPAAASAFRERWLGQPLAIAAREAALMAAPPETLPFRPLATPCTRFDATRTSDPDSETASADAAREAERDGVAFARWQAGLALRAAGRAWRFRQHGLPLVLALGALIAAAAPFIAHALDPAASGAAAAPSPMIFVDRLGALRWDLLLGVAAAWYAIVPLRFARRLARACESEAREGAAALVSGLGTRFDASFGSAWRAEVVRRRSFVTEIRRGGVRLARID